jgi:hypothetical protein
MREGGIKSREIIALYRCSGRGVFWDVFQVDRAGDRGTGRSGEGRFSRRELKKLVRTGVLTRIGKNDGYKEIHGIGIFWSRVIQVHFWYFQKHI